MNVFWTLFLGLIAGVLSGMFGIGGGLIIVPALILFAQVPAKTAIGTSLFALMWPVGALGVLEYWRERQIRLGQGLLISLGLFVGALFGARITLAISTSTMKRLYAVFLITTGIYFLLTTRGPADDPRPEISSQGVAAEPDADQVH